MCKQITTTSCYAEMCLLYCHLYGRETSSLTLREKPRLRVFENRVLGRVFWPKRDEITGEWRKLHNWEINVLYSSPNVVHVIKWRRMRWAGHVARMEGEACTGFWCGNLGERDHWKDPDVDGKIILGWIFRKWGMGYGLDRAGSG